MTIWSRAVPGLILVFLSAAFLPSQSMNARIMGTVEDEDGIYLTGVLVTATNVTNNAETAITTEGKKGGFRFPALAPGTYQVSFDLEGYRSYVASGIKLSAEQSVTLRIKLKKTDQYKNTKTVPGKPGTENPAEGRNLGIDAAKGRLSFGFSAGLNYLALGDSDLFLKYFYYRSAGFVIQQLETFHSGVDLNAEIGYRITPRLQVAVGLGLIRDRHLDNELKTGNVARISDIYRVGISVKDLPLQFICRYRLGSIGKFSYGLYGAILFNFASWDMQVQHVVIPSDGGLSYLQGNDQRHASARGWGFAFGASGEMKVSKSIAFTIDLGGRYAPLRRFSGDREYNYVGQAGGPFLSRGDLWFFEYYNSDLHNWTWELGIGSRPEGPGTRNVSRAKVDFSGMALRLGMVFRF